MKSKFEYRGAFLADAAGFLLGYGTQFLLIWVLVTKFQMIRGWKPFEVMFLYAMTILSYTFAFAFLGSVTQGIQRKILYGDFDQSLTKPMNPFTYEVASAFSSYYFTHFLVALGLLVICLVNLGIHLTIIKLFFLILFIAGSALIQGGFMLLLNSASFWFLGNNSPARDIFMSCRQLVTYPLSLYPKALQIFLTAIIPFGFISFYPAQYFINKNDFLMFNPVLQYLNPLVGILVFIFAYWVWSQGIKRYQSSGT